MKEQTKNINKMVKLSKKIGKECYELENILSKIFGVDYFDLNDQDFSTDELNKIAESYKNILFLLDITNSWKEDTWLENFLISGGQNV